MKSVLFIKLLRSRILLREYFINRHTYKVDPTLLTYKTSQRDDQNLQWRLTYRYFQFNPYVATT